MIIHVLFYIGIAKRFLNIKYSNENAFYNESYEGYHLFIMEWLYLKIQCEFRSPDEGVRDQF
jgi:hypothetical protein